MNNDDRYDLQIIIASGADNPCRARLGFETALASMASSLKVVVFLATGGVLWGMKEINSHFGCGFDSVGGEIQGMIELLQQGGARIEVCSACVGDACPKSDPACQGRTPTALLDGVTLGGLAVVAIRSSRVNTLTF